MDKPSYWLDLFTGTTWKEFVESGAKISGFRESRWKSVQSIKRGDYLLCYLTGVSRFIGVLEVVAEGFIDHSPIWKDEDFPSRLKVKPIILLTPETAVPVQELRDQLSMFKDMKSPIAWTGSFRGSPAKWKSSDAEIVLKVLRAAKDNPIPRPVDPAKLARRPKALKAKIGLVTIPGVDALAEGDTTLPGETRPHTEIQYLLLKLGSDMGLDVWVARNDRGNEWNGHKFSEIPRMKSELPLQFDEATTRTIELIDVLWLKGNAIAAAFEVESTTSIYSGLLRMSDLITMQPNLNIPLFLVAPDERRDKVITEVNRPTFSHFDPPLVDMCRYISFSTLRQRLQEVAPVVKYLKPEFLDELSESCEAEDV